MDIKSRVVAAAIVGCYMVGLPPVGFRVEELARAGFWLDVPYSAAEKADADRLHPVGSRTIIATSTGSASVSISITDHTEYTPGAASWAIVTELNRVATLPIQLPPSALR